MKNILFSIALMASLVFGSTLAFADSTAHQSGARHTEMNAQKLKKGLNETLVVENGKDSWVLHQPKENAKQYFLPTSEGNMAGGRHGGSQSQQQEG